MWCNDDWEWFGLTFDCSSKTLLGYDDESTNISSSPNFLTTRKRWCWLSICYTWRWWWWWLPSTPLNTSAQHRWLEQQLATYLQTEYGEVRQKHWPAAHSMVVTLLNYCCWPGWFLLPTTIQPLPLPELLRCPAANDESGCWRDATTATTTTTTPPAVQRWEEVWKGDLGRRSSRKLCFHVTVQKRLPERGYNGWGWRFSKHLASLHLYLYFWYFCNSIADSNC